LLVLFDILPLWDSISVKNYRTRRTFLEIDRAAWCGIADARRKILKGQMVFVDRLLESAMAACRDNR